MCNSGWEGVVTTAVQYRRPLTAAARPLIMNYMHVLYIQQLTSSQRCPLSCQHNCIITNSRFLKCLFHKNYTSKKSWSVKFHKGWNPDSGLKIKNVKRQHTEYILLWFTHKEEVIVLSLEQLFSYTNAKGIFSRTFYEQTIKEKI